MSQVNFSVIIPMKNAAKFIKETLESLIAQTYSNWEAIIIDDCSTDNGESIKIVKDFQKQNSQITLIELKKSKGSSGARNEGLLRAKGRYIAFLDSDDIWHEQYLQTMYDHIQECKSPEAAIFYCGYRRMDNNCETPVLPDYCCEGERSFHDFLYHCPVFPSICIVDKSKIKKPVQFREELKSLRDDYAYLLDILSQNLVAIGYSDILVDYRMRKDSMTASKFKMIVPQWNVYTKVIGLSPLKSAYYLFCWATNGIRKYFLH